MTDARKYIVPELMEAYLKGDVETLKLWCSEAVSVTGKWQEARVFTCAIDIQCFDCSHSSTNATRINQ